MTVALFYGAGPTFYAQVIKGEMALFLEIHRNCFALLSFQSVPLVKLFDGGGDFEDQNSDDYLWGYLFDEELKTDSIIWKWHLIEISKLNKQV
ncbi:hypothetical protein MKW98_004249 [Papaver atlanticum]|uniref:Uncharacterized protein n=1 Tax=Papaver atlanticum TaxID=357466 RepID=A0AAD4TA67_9MAGN|nr:hypothetical protein MKW98_004249 [Papaver atlanticum]